MIRLALTQANQYIARQTMIELFRKGSTSLKELEVLTAKIKHLHLYRWKHFVDSSDHGENCRYAKASIRAYVMDDEARRILDLIQRIRLRLDHVEALVLSKNPF